MNLSDILPPERVREIAEDHMDPWTTKGPVNCCCEAINSAAPEIARAVLEMASSHIDSMHERIVDGWNSFTEERADGAHNALRNAAKELRQLAKEITDGK